MTSFRPLNLEGAELMTECFQKPTIKRFNQHVISSSSAITPLSSARETFHQPLGLWTGTYWILILQITDTLSNTISQNPFLNKMEWIYWELSTCGSLLPNLSFTVSDGSQFYFVLTFLSH